MAWKTILEGEDPMPALAAQRSAHAQLNSAGENLSDKMLAYAMTLALPESFTTLKQTLWLRESLSSSEVQAGVQAEWSRRKTEGESATGMFAKSKFRSKSTFNNPKKQFDRFPWPIIQDTALFIRKLVIAPKIASKTEGKVQKA
ncbi:hypothetical protein M231_08006 [Tremella mesenterica]|uniref:Uncharacterized protein n=1 Tax=Tremella mesenterica TaxID=5217 RepID=A0A4Q1B7T4_TREME|nr:hypothetical protein M231_08006 [Tremella mesenterica]